ncbi:MAG: sensor histidine kinase [Gammaproteobacteria bacterium]
MALPSIRRRLADALLWWSLAWSVAVAAAVWLAARHEVDELLDDTLRASAEVLGAMLAGTPAATPPAAQAGGRFAWQVVDAQGGVRARSAQAPEQPLHATPSAGFSDTADWRVFGAPLGGDGRMLYVAQTRAERVEAHTEVVLGAVTSALAIGLLGHLWLRARVRRELEPLQRLSSRLAAHDPAADPPRDGAGLGAAERDELQPVHAAVDTLTQRLAQRIADERAFAGHAAHALRTPLAGIDAQLAVALREAPPALPPRLPRVRDAAARLQPVVAALLGLFRSGAAPRRERVALGALLARLPLDGLVAQVDPAATIDADPDLLAAALINLFDNARRHGATHVEVGVGAPATLWLRDDGDGVDAPRRAALQAAIDAQDYEGRTGLGLMLADRIARAHGGSLHLPQVQRGFAVELRLGTR